MQNSYKIDCFGFGSEAKKCRGLLFYPFGNDTPVMRYGVKACFDSSLEHILVYGGMSQQEIESDPVHRQNLSSVYSYSLKENRFQRIDTGAPVYHVNGESD